MKEKIYQALNSSKNIFFKVVKLINKNKKKVIIGLSVFLVVFISVFSFINLRYPTKINAYIAHVINKGEPANKYFDDENFYKCVIDNYNDENSKSVSYTTNLTNSQLSSINGLWCSGKNISSVIGLNKLSSLTYLDLSKNPHLKKIDMSGLNKLNNFNINYNYLLTSTINKVDKKLYFPINQKYIINTNVILPTQFSISNITDSMNRIESEKINDNSFYVKLSTVYDNEININYYNSVSKKTSSFYEDVRGFSFEEYDNIVLLNNDTYSIKPQINPSDDSVLNSFYLQNNCNSDALSIDGNTIKALKGKNCSVTIKNDSNLYSIDVPINIVEINSSIYDINYKDKYIYMGNHYLTKQLKENINVINGEIVTDETKYVNLKYMDVNYNSESIRSFVLSYVRNIPYSKYNLLGNSKYVYTKSDTDEQVETKFKSMRKINLSSKIDLDQNTLKLYNSNDSTSNTYNIDLVRLSSKVYDLSKNYIYVGTGIVDLSNINIVNGDLNINQNKVEIGYNDEILDSYNIAKISSDKYLINSDTNYIYTKTDVDENTILSNITFDNINGRIENNKLILYDEDTIVDEYSIVNISSNKYKIGSDYIYSDISYININNIICNNCSVEVSNESLNIKYNEEIIDTKKIASISSEVYDLNKNYIYDLNNSFDVSDIKCINCKVVYENNKLTIRYNDDVLKEIDVVSINFESSEYDLSKDYIYIGTGSFDESKIKSENITYEIENNILKLKYKDELLKSYKLVSISSDVYQIKDKYLYVFDSMFDKSNIKVTNGTFDVANNKVTIKYDEDKLDEFDIVGISSSVYDLKNGYILLKTNEKLDLSLINTANVTLDLHGDTLNVLFNDEVIRTYKIVRYESSKYDLTKDYIYLGMKEFNKDDMVLENCTVEEKDNSLNIKYGDEIVRSYKLVRVSSNNYKVGNGYVYTKNEEFNSNLLDVTNASIEEQENSINIMYGKDKLDEFKLLKVTSNTYNLTKDYIYDNNFNKDNIKVTNVSLEEKDNTLNIKYNDEVLDSKKIVKATSNTYDLTKDYIYIGNKELDESKFNLINCTLQVDNDTLNIKYDNDVLKSYKLVKISSNTYDLNKNYIYVGSGIFDKNLLSVINGTTNVLNDKIEIKYNNDVLKEFKLLKYSSNKYDLTKEYIYLGINNFDKNNISLVNLSLSVDDNHNLNIKYGNDVMKTYKLVSVSSSKYDLSKDNIRVTKSDGLDFKDIKVTNGTKEYLDNKLYIKYNDDILKVYTISTRAKGDITGDDKITIADVSLLYRHVRGTKVIKDSKTLEVSDLTGDDKITIADVAKLYRYVRGKITEL